MNAQQSFASRKFKNPIYAGYFADPFILRIGGRYIAYGTGSVVDGLMFEILESSDLTSWSRVGGALQLLPNSFGTDYWAPEVVVADGKFFMYYSLGFGDRHHHLRVALADSAEGPFIDQGVNLTPHEEFAIDPNPFQDIDGRWYLFYARDVLDADRIGTHLAVDAMQTMTSLAGEATPVLSPTADWQIYERGRSMYGLNYDWHTLEGPAVVLRNGRYYCFYSGGSWLNDSYTVAWAMAHSPRGPWREPQSDNRLLVTIPGHVRGPGHNSIVTTLGGTDIIAYHAWDESFDRRQMWIDPIEWTPQGPRTNGPTWGEQQLPD